jgi:hypothetical protein
MAYWINFAKTFSKRMKPGPDSGYIDPTLKFSDLFLVTLTKSFRQ